MHLIKLRLDLLYYSKVLLFIMWPRVDLFLILKNAHLQEEYIFQLL